MAWNWESLISGAISGGLIGAAASLGAIRLNWWVEKKRMKIQVRRNRIHNWRGMVMTASTYEFHSSGSPSFRVKLKRLDSYRSLRKELDPGLAREIETEWPEGNVESEEEIKGLVLDAIADIERRWDLV